MRRTLRRLAATPVPPPPPRVLVLSMSLETHGMAAALRTLGYHPYTFADVYKYGHILHHPREWLAVLDGDKAFDTTLLTGHRYLCTCRARHDASVTDKHEGDDDDDDAAAACLPSTQPSSAPAVTASASAHEGVLPRLLTRAMAARVADELRCHANCRCSYDALVGPPAAAAWPAVLRCCPPDTRVVLVEQSDKVAAVREAAALAQSLLAASRRGSLVVGDALHTLVTRMTSLQYAMLTCRGEGDAAARAAVASACARAPLSGVSAMSLLGEYEELVKATVPAEQLLVYRREQGWAPLCAFLQHSLPMSATTAAVARASASARARSAADMAALPMSTHDGARAEVRTLAWRTRKIQALTAVVACVVVACIVMTLAMTWTTMRHLFVSLRDKCRWLLPRLRAHIEDEASAHGEQVPTAHTVLVTLKRALVKELPQSRSL